MKSQLEDFGYKVTVKAGPGEDDTPVGSIVTQNVAIISGNQSNVVVQKQSSTKTIKYNPEKETIEIILYVYEGKKTVPLPDFAMEKSRDVIVNNEYTFTFEEIREYNDLVPDGYIIKSEPAAGTMVELDAVIKIYVSRGEKNLTVKMPDVLGMDGTEAIRFLVSKGFVIGDVKYLPDDKNARDVVINQSIPVSTEVPANTVVDLILSQGPLYDDVPDETEEPTDEDVDSEEYIENIDGQENINDE